MEPFLCSLEPRFHGSMVPPKKNLGGTMEPWNLKCVAWNLGSMVPWFHPTKFLIFDIEILGGTMEPWNPKCVAWNLGSMVPWFHPKKFGWNHGTMEPKMCSLEPGFHGSMVPPSQK